MIVYKCDFCCSEFDHNEGLPPINIYKGYSEGKKGETIYSTENIKHVCQVCRLRITNFITNSLIKID